MDWLIYAFHQVNELTEPLKKSPEKPKWRRRLSRALRIGAVILVAFYGLFWWNVLRIVEHDHWPIPEDAVTSAQALEVTQQFVSNKDARRDDAAIAYAPSTASEVDLFLDGVQFFPGMIEDMQNAEHSINILQFGFTPGGWGDTFADLLIERAADGVDVRVIVDSQGSKPKRDNEEFYNRLAEGGVMIVVNDVTTFPARGELPDRDHELRLDLVGHTEHRKLIVIDGEIGWVGGAGLEDHYHDGGWLDTYVRVKGDVVRQLQSVFIMAYHGYGGSLPDDISPFFPTPEEVGEIRVTVLQNFPGGFTQATQGSSAVLEGSTGLLDVMNAYFTDAGMINRIVEASERGVDVRIIAAQDSNVWPAAFALESQYGRLIDAGVEIWVIPGVVHAKVTVADDTLIIGSLNYDAWALYRNLELVLMFEDAGVADAARAQLIAPVVAEGTQPDPPEGLSEELPAKIWWWLRYFL